MQKAIKPKAKQARSDSGAEFQKIVESPHIASSVIVGQIMIANLLELAISEVMPSKHSLELSHVPFPLKLDLAIALGLLPSESRTAYLKLNRLRNRFAHDWMTTFDATDAAELYNCLSRPMQYAFGNKAIQKTDKAMLEQFMCVLFVELQVTVTRVRDQKAVAEIQHEIVEELRRTLPPLVGPSKTELEIEQKLEEARKKRRDAGEL